MKKLLRLLGTISLTATSTISLMACGGGKPNKILNSQDENEKLQGENEELHKKNKKLKDENQKLKWKINKSILFIDSINPPIMVNAVQPNKVKEYELVIALIPKVLEAVKTIDDSLTKNDFVIVFKDYFNHRQPHFIDLTTPKKIRVIIGARNKTIDDKEFDVLLPVASNH